MRMVRTGLLAATALAFAWTPAWAANFSNDRIDVIVKATTSQYWATVFDGADAAAQKLGVTINKLGASAETDVAQEVSIMENAIQSKPTGIVIAATNAQALAQPIASATDAGIPVIVIDSDANTNKYVTFLATNNEAAGEKAADQLASCVKARTGKEDGDVAYLTALAGAQSLNDRDKGFVQELKKYPGLKIVEHRTGNNDPGRALSDSEDLLTRHPNLVGIFADNEIEGDGTGRALQEKNVGSKVCAIAFDTSDEEIHFVRDGNLDALIVQNPYMMGYAGVWYALAAADGVVLPHRIDSGSHVVTKKNIDSPKMAGLLNPMKYQLSPFLGS
jgi:ribose transport system substrate-binding protein